MARFPPRSFTRCLRDAAESGDAPSSSSEEAAFISKRLPTAYLRCLPPEPELRAELDRTELPELVDAGSDCSTLSQQRNIDTRQQTPGRARLGSLHRHRRSLSPTSKPPGGKSVRRYAGCFSSAIETISRSGSSAARAACSSEESLEETRSALQAPLSETASRIIGLTELQANFLGGRITRTRVFGASPDRDAPLCQKTDDLVSRGIV